MPNDSAMSCQNLSKYYCENNQKLEILNNINFSLPKNTSCAILGSSGSGKSTLLHVLAGLDDFNSGEVFIDSINISKLTNSEKAKLRNHKIGFIYQMHHLLPDFTALENVMLPLLIRNQIDSKSKISIKTIREKSLDVLSKVGLKDRSNHKPSQLSGGEKQRVAIARAVITEPSIIFADEPTGNLDPKTAIAVFEVLQDLKSQYNTTLLVVTHDLQLAAKLDQTLYLQDGLLLSKI